MSRSLLFAIAATAVTAAVVSGQFQTSVSNQYPRIKIGGPLGSLIGGQGISLGQGLGSLLNQFIQSQSGLSAQSQSQPQPSLPYGMAASAPPAAYEPYAGLRFAANRFPAYDGLYAGSASAPLGASSLYGQNLFGFE